MQVKEIFVKSILSRSGIYGIEYSINPYFGCMHGCLYCYARYMLKLFPTGFNWGEFVHVKVNAPRLLMKDLRKARFGRVLLSSITDPYQPIEAQYKLTRRLLSILSSKNFPVTLLTKSSLILRDVDLFRRFRDIEIGLTLTTLDERVRSIFEPRASSILDRIKALRELRAEGFRVFAFLGPLIPIICEWSLRELIEKLAEIRVNYIVFDKLNIRAGNWPHIRDALQNNFPKLSSKISKILLNRNSYARYYSNLKKNLISLASSIGVEVDFCY